MDRSAQVVGLSVVAVGALAWCTACRAPAKCYSNNVEELESWKQISPRYVAAAGVKEFGETNLQAKLVTKRLTLAGMRERAQAFFSLMNTRRTMRFFSQDDIPQDVLELCLAVAGTSPSGAHHQPWFFAVIRDASVKFKIRELVEEEEKVNYEKRMRKSWIQDLSSMTGETADSRLRSANGSPLKPYLTEAPALIAMFKQTHSVDAAGKRVDNYYVNESCGIAAGFFLAALHNVGLATLTSTPMGSEQAIRQMLHRPDNEKLFLLLPVGYPASDATVPFRTPLRKATNHLFAML